MELLSNCCSGRINPDNDFCGTCWEHCGAMDENDEEYEYQVNKWVNVSNVGSMEEKMVTQAEEINLEENEL